MNILDKVFPKDVATIIHKKVTQLKFNDVLRQFTALSNRCDCLIRDDDEYELDNFFHALRFQDFFTGWIIYKFYRGAIEDEAYFRATLGTVK